MREQAEIQFQKLMEVAHDIEQNGTAQGDHQKRNIVISGLVNTENEFLYNMFDEALTDFSHPDIFHTLICGIYLHKDRFASLAQYVDSVMNDVIELNEKYENKQALLLCAEGLIKACANDDKVLSKKFLPTLKKLFISSCLENSSSLLADKLLQTFLTRMSIENEVFSEFLFDIIKDTKADFNARLVAIDLITRVDKPSGVEVVCDIFNNPNSYAQNGTKLLYLLDVTTKAIKYLKHYFESSKLLDLLSTLNNLEYSVAADDEYSKSIVERIKTRIQDINDEMNLNN